MIIQNTQYTDYSLCFSVLPSLKLTISIIIFCLPLFSPLSHVLLILPIIFPIFSLPRFLLQPTPCQTSSSHKISHHSSISSNYFSPFLFKLAIYFMTCNSKDNNNGLVNMGYLVQSKASGWQHNPHVNSL